MRAQDNDGAFTQIRAANHVSSLSASICEVLEFNGPAGLPELFGDIVTAFSIAFRASDAWAKLHLSEDIVVCLFTIEIRLGGLARLIRVPEKDRAQCEHYHDERDHVQESSAPYGFRHLRFQPIPIELRTDLSMGTGQLPYLACHILAFCGQTSNEPSPTRVGLTAIMAARMLNQIEGNRRWHLQQRAIKNGCGSLFR